jgi:hypothetical protein
MTMLDNAIHSTTGLHDPEGQLWYFQSPLG